MIKQPFVLLLLAFSVGLLPACSMSSDEGGGADAQMTLQQLSNGFGQLVPYTIHELDESGLPTLGVVSIRTQQDLIDNLRFEGGVDNQILPVPQWPTTAMLPSGAPGNHFIYVRFTQPIAVESVLDPTPGQSNSGLIGSVTVQAIDPQSGEAASVQGRAFVNGRTYAGTPSGSPPTLSLEEWVRLENGQTVAATPDGEGFPGTDGGFSGDALLVQPETLVFVVDEDDNLSTYETFPTGVQIRMRVTTAVRAENGEVLESTILGSSTVGPDTLGPEIVRTPPPVSAALISPGNGDTNVDPETSIRFEFTEPVQPLSVGPLEGASPPGASSLIQLTFGPSTTRTEMVYTVRPVSVFDFSVFEVIPAYPFPGAGPGNFLCNTFSRIDITINPSVSPEEPLLRDLSDDGGQPNGNQFGAETHFTTGTGEGVTNAPVSPDTIYVGRLGANPGLSVIDLNGFGQSTGTPAFNTVPGVILEGESNFPNNPNLTSPGLVPPLAAGTCTIDGGSAGVFTLTKNSALDDLLIRPPTLTSIGDLMIGHALDAAFNNAVGTGCQTGGNICAVTGNKSVSYGTAGPNTLGPSNFGQVQSGSIIGTENLLAWAPHPNPPGIIYPPLCVDPFLNAQEPSSVDNIIGLLSGTVTNFVQNRLVPGDPFGTPSEGIPPTGILTPEQNAWFVGPSYGVEQISNCNPYMVRQQVGHFLYLIDRQAGEVVVLNSNRMTVIDRILLPDPTSLAMGPNLDLLGVTSQQANVVSFIDIDPNNPTFHQVIATTVVGVSPRGIAWDPGNEDILVCNEVGNSVSIIDAASLQVRKTVSAQLNGPFEVAVTPRMRGHGFGRNVYFAFILNRSGRVAVFESGPNGVNGWGFDDVIGSPPFIFENPKTIQPGPINLFGSVFVVHENPLTPAGEQSGQPGTGAITDIRLESATFGQLSLGATVGTPQFRDMAVGINGLIGGSQLSGIPVDIAFDNQRNFSQLENPTTEFSAGTPAVVNGKQLIRGEPINNLIVNCNEAQFLFAAVPNSVGTSGVVDVMRLSSSGIPRVDTNAFRPGIQSIPVANANFVVDYFRQ